MNIVYAKKRFNNLSKFVGITSIVRNIFMLYVTFSFIIIDIVFEHEII